jgi:hypothetical protein
MGSSTALLSFLRLFILLIGTMIWTGPALSVPMAKDPKGFQNIPWGTPLTSRQDLEVCRSDSPVTEYRQRTGPPSFAGAEMTSIRFLALDGQFARVTIRYHGEQVHNQVLKFLEDQFGPVERIPGQMVRGLTQQYNWRGSETEINLTYQAGTERGYIFIDSRTLAPRFNDNLPE